MPLERRPGRPGWIAAIVTIAVAACSFEPPHAGSSAMRPDRDARDGRAAADLGLGAPDVVNRIQPDGDAGDEDALPLGEDAAVDLDGGGAADAAAVADAGVRDGGAGDASTAVKDATPFADASAPDAVTADTGARDAGFPDAQPARADATDTDRGRVDTGTRDAAPPDTGADAGCVGSSSNLDRVFLATDSAKQVDFGDDPAFALIDDFTIELWLKPTDSDGDPTSILERRGAAGTRDGWRIAISDDPASSGVLVIFQWTESGSVWTLGPSAITLNEWHHVTVQATRNALGNSGSLFIDGELKDGDINLPDASPDPAARLRIPPHDGPSDRMNTRIDAIHVSSRPRRVLNFTPEVVPRADEASLGLWLMNESDTSARAADVLCRNHGVTMAGSFVSDSP